MPVPDTTPNPVAERLAYLRSRHQQLIDKFAGIPKPGICASDRHRWPCHASTLLDVADAAVKRADGWAAEAVRFDGIADSTDAGDMQKAALAASQAYDRCARELRDDIARILLAEEANHG